MKKFTFIALLLSVFCFHSCEDVVNIDLNTAAPKLAVTASIYWKKGTSGNEQTIKLTTTTDYHSNTIPTASGAIVYIADSANIRYVFNEIPNSGKYICTNFKPVLNETYVLTIVYKSETYTATETLKSVAPITRIEQNNQGGITGKDIQIKTYFNDPADQDNYYMYYYGYSDQLKSAYYVDDDKFYQGNEFFSLSRNEDLKAGNIVEISHFGISKGYYNYMSILINISGQNTGGPFQAPPAIVKGNIINKTNASNYPLGYFSLSETDTRTYIIK